MPCINYQQNSDPITTGYTSENEVPRAHYASLVIPSQNAKGFRGFSLDYHLTTQQCGALECSFQNSWFQKQKYGA